VAVASAGLYASLHPMQTTTTTSHHSVFTGRMPFLTPNQQHQSTEGNPSLYNWVWLLTQAELYTTALLLQQPFYGSVDCTGEPVPEETFTHSHVSLSWSSVIPCLLPPSVMIYGILPVQLTCLTVFLHNLCPSFLWSTSWPGTLHFILHTFLHPIIVFFSQHISIPSQPVLLSTKFMSSKPSLSGRPDNGCKMVLVLVLDLLEYAGFVRPSISQLVVFVIFNMQFTCKHHFHCPFQYCPQ